MEEEIKRIIHECDLAIKREDFDTLLSHYTEDAVLVVKPGLVAKGKKKIRDAFVAIAKYFNNSLVPTQGNMVILDAGDTALVLSQTLLAADKEESVYSMDRRATYVFTKCADGIWRCAVDNSYGTDLLTAKLD